MRQPRAQVPLDAPPVLPASLSMNAWAEVDRGVRTLPDASADRLAQERQQQH